MYTLEARPIISSTDPLRANSIVKLQRREDGAYSVGNGEAQDVLVEMRPDGGWDLYTSGPPTQLGLWRDKPNQLEVKRGGLLGWLGFKKNEEQPANGQIEPSEVRPLEFIGDNASNRDRYREIFGDELFPQMLIRVGWAPLNADPLTATPRRPLSDVVSWLDDDAPFT